MLEKYKEKRDFKRTPEPAPGAETDERGPLLFVVQKHAATRLHYDFRLEVDGVLKSWPIPKGPSLNPQDKRLAVMVEDHPLDYAPFEGVIPKGEYGGGQVIVWDAGTYSPDEGGKLSFDDREEAEARMREGLAKGKISIFLRGRKLKGSWTLVRTKRSEKDWLLIKHHDEFVDLQRDITQEDRSVLSGLSIADIKAGRLPERRPLDSLLVRPGDIKGARAADFPKSFEPMHASLSQKSFSSENWLFEPKLDGVRAVSFIDNGRVSIFSRRGLDATRQYPVVAKELEEQPESQLVLDGEIVALDDSGIPSFQRLQQRLNLTRETDIQKAEKQVPVLYYVFDVLYAGGYDLRSARLDARKALLEQIVMPSERVLLVDHFEEDGEVAYKAAIEHGLEGLIAKKRDSVYESGRRSRNWLKIKGTKESEFVIGGYTEGGGWRANSFGSLLLGYYDDAGKLVYAGHVGTGFNDKMLKELKDKLRALRADESPFAVVPSRGSLVFGRPKSAPTTWVKPELVARVKFAQWTDEGILRAPSFQGLRTDKAPADVRREEAVPPPAPVAGGANGEEGAGGVLEQLARPEEKFILKAQGHKIPVTNLDKELWPAVDDRRALTKRDLLVYLAKISPYLLPHMRDRPLTLTRYPNGIYGGHFYQKRFESKVPEFVQTVRLYSQDNKRDVEYIVCNNLPTLLWLGQLADIELHTWYSRISPEPDGHHLPTTFAGSARKIDQSLLNYPDFIVFDLDPYIYSGKEKKGAEPELNRKAFLKTCDVALWLKDVLDSLSLSSFVKTTGRTGLHIYVPILRQFDYDTVRSACETIGKFLLQAHPRDITMEWTVEKRTGKVFFDHNQNVRGKTLASLYSPRPSPEAAVSMPIRWDEIKEVYPSDFTIVTAAERVEKTGDLWSGILAAKHDLASMLGALGEDETH
ncbi:MAG TPA: DNA ligase D [Dehalococcoidia bacterium]|nr:DNA ligase D [Dehalococcoidia bacterium]